MSDFASLYGRRAVVTGAATGIGREIALEFARAGADVIVHTRRNRSGAERTCQTIRSFGRWSEIVVADIAEADDRASLVERAFDLLGPIDLWTNNAGVDLLTGDEADLPYDEKLRRLLDVDVTGTILLSKRVGERMQASDDGVILTVGWDQSDRGMGGNSGELFSAAKNAIMGFTRSLAVSLAPSIRVNCLAPGWIKTAWGESASSYWQQRVRAETPLKRWGTPQDVARLARFLASREASYITGQVVNVNGGAVR